MYLYPSMASMRTLTKPFTKALFLLTESDHYCSKDSMVRKKQGQSLRRPPSFTKEASSPCQTTSFRLRYIQKPSRKEPRRQAFAPRSERRGFGREGKGQRKESPCRCYKAVAKGSMVVYCSARSRLKGRSNAQHSADH